MIEDEGLMAGIVKVGGSGIVRRSDNRWVGRGRCQTGEKLLAKAAMFARQERVEEAFGSAVAEQAWLSIVVEARSRALRTACGGGGGGGRSGRG